MGQIRRKTPIIDHQSPRDFKLPPKGRNKLPPAHKMDSGVKSISFYRKGTGTASDDISDAGDQGKMRIAGQTVFQKRG